MMTSLATIGLTLVTHPLQMLMVVVALYHAGAALFGSRSFNRDRPPKAAAKPLFQAVPQARYR